MVFNSMASTSKLSISFEYNFVARFSLFKIFYDSLLVLRNLYTFEKHIPQSMTVINQLQLPKGWPIYSYTTPGIWQLLFVTKCAQHVKDNSKMQFNRRTTQARELRALSFGNLFLIWYIDRLHKFNFDEATVESYHLLIEYYLFKQ